MLHPLHLPAAFVDVPGNERHQQAAGRAYQNKLPSPLSGCRSTLTADRCSNYCTCLLFMSHASTGRQHLLLPAVHISTCWAQLKPAGELLLPLPARLTLQVAMGCKALPPPNLCLQPQVRREWQQQVLKQSRSWCNGHQYVSQLVAT